MRLKSPATRRLGKLVSITTVLLVLSAVSPTPAVGVPPQLTGQSRTQGAAAFDARVELVTLSVSVLDDNGAPVADLTAADFRIFEDGALQQTALVLTPGETPLDIALIVDLSQSMRSADWRDRARDFLEALAPDDCAFLLGFSTDVGGSVWGTPDDEILADALREADAAGGTALFDALLIGLRELEAADSGGTLRGAARGSLNPAVRGSQAVGVRANNPCPSPMPPGRENDPDFVRRKAIVVVSDGVDSTSQHDADAVLIAVELSGIPIFPIELDSGGFGRGGRGGRRGRGPRLTPLPDWASEGVLPALAEATGGKTVRGSDSGYREVLAWLRGTYIVGYYTSANPEYGSSVDFTRHELVVELNRDDVEVIHQPAYFRPTIDTEAAKYEVAQASDLIAEGELESALLILDRALRADPRYAPAYFNRAIARGDLGRLEEAQRDALEAASLSPGIADMHELAMLISIDVGDSQAAWEQAIQAGQAGADLRPHFERLDAAGPAPADFDAQVSAPTIMVARPYTETTNLLMDTALAKVFQTVRRELAAAPLLAVVVDPSMARYVMTIRGDRLSSGRPRRLDGEMIVTELSGREVYSKVLLLNDVDSPTRIASDMARFLRDLETKLER
ncbi:MAG: VWA domain-containing protein [Acidobacteria bacterium]|nr:VWA domain-containing protein [Acidobacteriota bacterium]